MGVIGCTDGSVKFWDLEGKDRGEKIAELRSLKHWEFFLPIILLLISFVQVSSFAFGPEVPWSEEVKGRVKIAVHIVTFDIHINQEWVFWPKTLIATSFMLFFNICAFIDLPSKLRRVGYTIRKSQRYHDEAARGSTCGPTHMLVRVLITARKCLSF